MEEKAVYLGDGVYVKVDDWGTVVLMANSHINPTDTITLEPAVLRALMKLIKKDGVQC